MATKRKASEQASTPPQNKRARASSRISESASQDDMPRKRGTSRARRSAPVADKLTIPELIDEDEYLEGEEEDESVAATEIASEKATSPDKGLSEDEDDDDPLLNRIRAGRAYTRTQYDLNLPVMQTTRFAIVLLTAEYSPPRSQATALALLSAAYKLRFALLSSDSEDSSGNGFPGSKTRLSVIAEYNEEEEEAESPKTNCVKRTVVQEPSEDSSDSDAPLLPKMARRSPRVTKKVHQPAAATEAMTESDSDAPLLPRKVKRSSRTRKAAIQLPEPATEAASESDTELPVRPVTRNLRTRRIIRSSQPVVDIDGSDASPVPRGETRGGVESL